MHVWIRDVAMLCPFVVQAGMGPFGPRPCPSRRPDLNDGDSGACHAPTFELKRQRPDFDQPQFGLYL
jgi:hypothetical protein